MLFSDEINCLISLKGYQQEYSKRNLGTQKPLGSSDLVPCQPDKLLPQSLMEEFIQKKVFCFVFALSSITSCKILHISLIKEKNTSQDIRMYTIISIGPRQPSGSLISTNLRLPCFLYPSLISPIYHEENLHAGSKHRINYVNRICMQIAGALRPHLLNPRPKTSNSTGMLFAKPFWSLVD